jgi:hypothetical protein
LIPLIRLSMTIVLTKSSICATATGCFSIVAAHVCALFVVQDCCWHPCYIKTTAGPLKQQAESQAPMSVEWARLQVLVNHLPWSPFWTIIPSCLESPHPGSWRNVPILVDGETAFYWSVCPDEASVVTGET